MNTLSKFKNYGLAGMCAAAITISGCKKDEDLPVVPPAEENELEVITDVKLIFTNDNNTSDVVEARAQDPDGQGVEDLLILDTINLDTNKTYTLTYEILNNLETSGEDLGAEILEEDDEHQFFFSFSTDAFSNPTGNGNIDDASHPLNYDDVDGNGNPVGLSTSWTTSSTPLSGGSFTVQLQHQPDVKTASSTATDGDTDFNLTFVLNIQ